MRFLLVSLITMVWAGSAYAGNFYVLDLRDTVANGRSVVHLRQLMDRQFPGVLKQDSELMSVMMVAKTAKGNGRARLVVGGDQTPEQKVEGVPNKFKSISSNTFDRVLFKNPKNNSRGVWQLHLQGNFNLRQAVVELGINSQSLALNYGDRNIKTGNGDDGVLHLRQKARLDHGVNTLNYELEAVTLIAKSRNGNGRARLRVGQDESVQFPIGGSPANFNNNDIRTYFRADIENPKVNSDGVWQIHLDGNIKVREVILHMVQK